MLHLCRDSSRPTVIGHIYNYIGSIFYKTGNQISKYVFEADWSREADTRIGFKHYRIVASLPPVVVVSQQKIVEPRQLFLIGKMFGKGDKMLFTISLFNLPIFKHNNGIVIFSVPRPILIKGRKRLIL